MILKKGFFLVELMIAFSILSIFILTFLRFSYISLQVRNLALNRLHNTNEILRTIENRSVNKKIGYNLNIQKHSIELSKQDYFNFMIFEGEVNFNRSNFIRDKQKLLIVAPC